MERLIKPDVLQKYLCRNRKVNGISYEVMFEYAEDHPKDKDGIDIAHLVRVGFRSESGEEYTGNLYLPMVMENGLLSKNKSLWYRVNMLIPPAVFQLNGNVLYVNRAIGLSKSASSLNDFFPEVETMRFRQVTPLIEELYPDEIADVSDIHNWNIISIDMALLELFNSKIGDDIERSQRGGFLGISGSIRSMHTLLRAFVGYCRDEDDESDPIGSEHLNDLDEDEIEVGPSRIADKIGSVVIHPLIKDIPIKSGGPIDFCSGSQSKPIRTARIRDGYSIVDCRLVKGYDSVFPYATWRRSVVGIMADDPRRTIVSRGISRALRIEEPDLPFAVTDVRAEIDSVSIPGVRMTHPLNHEDGIVVSETFARKMAAFKTCVDRISVHKPVTVWNVKKPAEGIGVTEAREMLQAMWPKERDYDNRATAMNIIRRGDLLAAIQYKDMTGELVTKEIRTKVKSLGIVIKYELFTPADDIPEERLTHRFTSLVYYPLVVGDKVADAHGNKSTISAILPDEKMPTWEDSNGNKVRAHYIATPYVMKRLALGAEIEDKLALIGYYNSMVSGNKESVMVDSLEELSMKDVDATMEEYDIEYTGTVQYGGSTYEDVPISMRTMYRLDNNAKDALCGRATVEVDDFRRTSKNARLGIDIVTMISRGATVLVNQIIEKSGAKTYLNNSIIPMLHALSGNIPEGAGCFEIKARLDRESIGNPLSYESLLEMDLQDTACDPRISTMYGYIKVGKDKVIVPPHNAIQDLGKGCATFSRIAVYANRVFSEQHSRSRGYDADVNYQIARYKNIMAGMLTGKGGMIRDALLPVFPTTIRAVASSRMVQEHEDELTIAIPRREFNRLRKEHPSMGAVYNGRGKMYCLLKRDPVHRTNNVIAVPFVLWDNSTIGVSPLVIGGMDGDLDGDALFVMFPTDHESYRDLAKLVPDVKSAVVSSKVIDGVAAEHAHRELRKRVGWASTFGCPHESDVVKNPDLLAKLYNGMSAEERFDECMKAARAFEIIKDGTARTGALGLSFIFTRQPEQKHLVNSAMELYHVLAQNTLDAKAGIRQPALRVVDGVASGNEDDILAALKELGFSDEECIDELVMFTREQKNYGGRTRMLEAKYPVLAVTQRSARNICVTNIANRVCSNTSLGSGIWEAMMDYLMGNVDNSPYYWVDHDKVMTEKVKRLQEILSGK